MNLYKRDDINNSKYNDSIKKLNLLEENISKIKNNIGTEEYKKYVHDIFTLEKNFLDVKDEKYWKELQRLRKYILHVRENQHYLKNSILTIISTIFLPLGVIVGYFGMNFKSMGAPSLKKGIFNTEHAQHYVFWLGLIAAIGVILFFVFLEGDEIKKVFSVFSTTK